MPKGSHIKNIAIIPARGGSKRIPKKNIKSFLSKPIIAYSIEAAIQSNLFDTIMVSTDDEEIKKISENHGAQVPFFRSEKNSDDFASLVEVVTEVLDQYKQLGSQFNNFCCLLPTAPLIQASDLRDTLNILTNQNKDFVVPIVRYSYPIQRSLRINNENISMVWPENFFARSQDCEPFYHDAGLFFWGAISAFQQHKKVFTGNCGFFELPPTRVQDIDTIDDWELCEMKFKTLNSIE